jgi:hypothetical protein
MESFRSEMRAILPAWCICTLIPLPAIIFWRFLGGEPVAIFCFFACCLSLVASRFRPKVISQQPPNWHVKMLAMGAALVSSSIVFSLFWLGLADRQDFITPFIAFQAIIPSFCVVPYVTLLTRKPASAVILSGFLVGCMKMVAGIVVNLHFREAWHNGNHELPWTEPNLMLSAFWAATAILSVLFLFLGANEYRAQLSRVA